MYFFEKKVEEYSEKKINKEVEFVSFLEINSKTSELWNLSKSIECIASHLYLIDSDKIIGHPQSVFLFNLDKRQTDNSKCFYVYMKELIELNLEISPFIGFIFKMSQSNQEKSSFKQINYGD